MRAGFFMRVAIMDGFFGLVFCLMYLSVLLLTVSPPAAAQTWQVEEAFKETNLRGYTRSIRTAVLSAEVTGKLLQLNYDVGDVLEKKKLAQIDTTFVAFQIATTRVSLARIKIQSEKIISRIQYLTRELKRKEKLFSKGSTTEVIRDAAVQELAQARLELAALKQETISLGVTLNRLEETKARHGIWGPEQWVVTQKNVEEGEVVQAGTPLVVVQDFRQLVVPLSVSREELKAVLEKKEPFSGRLEGRPVPVRVDHVNPEFDEQTRKIKMQLMIPDAGVPHRGGLRFEMPVLSPARGVKIPVAAVVNRYADPRVFVQGEEGSVGITILDTVGGYFIAAETTGVKPGSVLIRQDTCTDAVRTGEGVEPVGVLTSPGEKIP